MKCFEFHIADITVTTQGDPSSLDYELMEKLNQDPTYAFSDDVMELLDDRLTLHPVAHFNSVSLPTIPWAIVCMDREYPISGHVIAIGRGVAKKIGFTAYSYPPDPEPKNFYPRVGIITIFDKQALKESAARSPIFKNLWECLADCAEGQRWILFPDPLDDQTLATIAAGDRELWIATR